MSSMEEQQYIEYERKWYAEKGYHIRNWAVPDSKSLIELWIKNLCTFLHHKMDIEESNYRTDDIDEFQSFLWAEGWRDNAYRTMKEIESIWNQEARKL